MTKAVTAVNNEHILALEILLSAEKIQRAPMRPDSQAYYEELVMNHLEPLVRGQLEQNRQSHISFSRQHGQQRVHAGQKPITDEKVRRIAFEEMLESLTRIKLWLRRNPQDNFSSKEELIQAAVTDFEIFREK